MKAASKLRLRDKIPNPLSTTRHTAELGLIHDGLNENILRYLNTWSQVVALFEGGHGTFRRRSLAVGNNVDEGVSFRVDGLSLSWFSQLTILITMAAVTMASHPSGTTSPSHLCHC